MTHRTRDRLLLALGTLSLAMAVAHAPAARSGEHNPGTTLDIPTQNTLANTFRQSPTFQHAINGLIDTVARNFASFLQATGLAPGAGTVSRYRNPDPTSLGYGPADRYGPPNPLRLTELERALGHERKGRRKTSVPGVDADPGLLHNRRFSSEPNPRPLDVPGFGIPGGGRPGDPFWARNCLCHAPTGATPGVTYQVDILCPLDDPPLICGTPGSRCGPIVRHDTFVQTIAECRRQKVFDPDEEQKVERGGGQPRAPFFGL